MLGLPPVWYKSAPYRSRAVIDPKGVLAEFGVTLPAGTEIRIWDSTAETRFLVVPMRPAGTDGWSEEQLAALVTRDSMVGTGLPKSPAEGGGGAMTNSIHDMGGMHGFGPVEPEPNEPVFHAEWEKRVLAMQRAMGSTGLWTIDGGRASLETLPPLAYLMRPTTSAGFSGSSGASWRMAWSARTRSPPAVRCGPAIRLNRKLTHRRRQGDALGEFRAAGARPGAVQGRRPGAHPNINPTTHTRLPRYARGKLGTVEAVRGCHVFPDTAAIGAGENPQWLYTVVFSGARIVGRGGRPRDQGVDRGLRALPRAGMSSRPDAIAAVPGIPRGPEGPVFREPWEAQAFAMTLALHERGLFSWGEWAAALADEIKRAQAAGDPDTGDTYYRHWLAALERLVAEKGMPTRHPGALSRRLGPRRRPHPARHADRAAARGFRSVGNSNRGSAMEFEHSAKVQALQARVEAFMAEEIYPNEEALFAQVNEGDRWQPVPLLDELKAKARAAGLWNLFLPESQYGAGLTNLEYAPLCEIMGRSPWAPEAFNCSAPDTGNMEVLVRYGTPEQQRALARAAARRRDPLGLCDDRARGRLVRRHQYRDPHPPRRQ